MLLLEGAKQRVEVLQFSPAGGGLLAACPGVVQLWSDVTACGPPTKVRTTSYIWSARFTPDGQKLLISLAWAGVLLHDLSTGKSAAAPQPLPASIGFCDLTPDGQSVVAAESSRGGATTSPGGSRPGSARAGSPPR